MQLAYLATFFLALTSVCDADACPFCTAESRTLTEELGDADIAVLARLIKPAASPELKPEEGVPYGTIDPDTGAAQFQVESVLLGDQIEPASQIEAIFFGEPDFDTQYLIRGIGDPLEWTIPLELSELAVTYVHRLMTLPKGGADRLAFFQDYLQHNDTLLAQDAYDEFARAPYDDVRGLKDRMDREQLLTWIESPTVSPSRRRLFLTMLGVCGRPEDLPRLEAMLLSDARIVAPGAEALAIASLATGGPLAMALAPETVRLDQRRKKLGLDAMVACYLTLRGEEGLDLIDERFLKETDVDYSHIYSTLMAIRFLAEETDLIPRDRLLQSARLLLENRDFADQVIPDLARWEDWSVLDQLVDMYRQTETGEYEKYIREPIVTYLDVAVEAGADRTDDLADRANQALHELEPIDKEAFRRARSLRAFGFLAQARPPSTVENDPGARDANLQGELESETASIDSIPNPADFVATAADEPAEMVGENEVSPMIDLPESNSEIEKSEISEDSATVVIASKPPTSPEEQPAPPSSALLIGAGVLTAGVFFGLFWLILRGGSA